MDANAQQGRVSCPGCGKRKFPYCENCLLILEKPTPAPIRLPIKVDIVQHGETNARSTALHAVLLAPANVRLFRHAGTTTSRRCDPLELALPTYDPATTAVLFPAGPDTPVVGHCAPYHRLVVLESNWRKARGLLQHPSLRGLRCVTLPPGPQTQFSWRVGDASYRGAVEGGLSSIEAIQQCCSLLTNHRDDFVGLLRYFMHTKHLVEQRGQPSTSRQQARLAKQRRQPTTECQLVKP